MTSDPRRVIPTGFFVAPRGTCGVWSKRQMCLVLWHGSRAVQAGASAFVALALVVWAVAKGIVLGWFLVSLIVGAIWLVLIMLEAEPWLRGI